MDKLKNKLVINTQFFLLQIKTNDFFCSNKNELLLILQLRILYLIPQSFKKELLQKAKYRHHNISGKEEAAEYCLKTREVLKEKAKNKYESLQREEKKAKREYGRNSYKSMKENAIQKSAEKMKY